MAANGIANQLLEAARQLREDVSKLSFGPPVVHVYNPLDYAWNAHACYLRRYGGSEKRVVFLGMNPGPFGMVQTAVPFGDVEIVRRWLGIDLPIAKPALEHPKKPVEGFHCRRSEVSGSRLWGLMAERFGRAEAFFEGHFVANYCPLAFLEMSGRNRTPDKLPGNEAGALRWACDRHLRRVVAILKPAWLVGVGVYAAKCAEIALRSQDLRVGRILHPSPANPSANRDWKGQAVRQLTAQGIW